MKKKCILLIIPLLVIGCEVDPDIEALPFIKTGTATSIGNASAKISIQFSCEKYPKEVGILLSTEETIFSDATTVLFDPFYDRVDGVLTKMVEGLTDGQTYYFWAFAKDDLNQYIVGNRAQFTTKRTDAKVTTGDWGYLGYDASKDYPFSYYYEASLSGLSFISSWGILLSTNEAFSNASDYDLPLINYVQGTTERLNLNWRFNSGYRTTHFFKAYAVLKTGETIYGQTKEVY